MNPLDLPGPQFLVFFGTLFAAALVIAIGLRWMLCVPGGAPPFEAQLLSPYEVAHLAGGPERAVNAAIARLVQQGNVNAWASDRTLTLGLTPPSRELPEIEQAIYAKVPDTAQDAVPDQDDRAPSASRRSRSRSRGRSKAATQDSVPIGELRFAASATLRPIAARLQSLGLVMTEDSARRAQLVPMGVLIAVLGLGVVKLLVGLSRDRPIGFLAIACALIVWVILKGFGRRPYRSRRGDQALAGFRRVNAALKTQAGRRAQDLSSDDLIVAVGLFGAGIFTSGRLASLATVLRSPPRKGDWGTGSSCGGSCGSSGGSSCGGGCGGGCGGCGS